MLQRRRRYLLAAIAFLGAPFARGQQAKTYRIGWLGSELRPPPDHDQAYNAFAARLRELGYVEGRNVRIERRYGEGRSSVLAQRAVELADQRVDLIVAGSTSAAAAASKATRTIPIVMGSAANPIAAGLVSNLSRPGGNITGLTLETADTTAKRLELLKEALPRLARVAAVHPAALRAFPVVAQWLRDNHAAAKQLGLALLPFDLRIDDVGSWEGAFQQMAARGLTAATVVETPTYLTERARFAQLALKSRIAAVFPFREQAEAGGLMAYGADVQALYRRAAELVDEIFRGAKPGELPIEQPTKFVLTINLRTARALEIRVPRSLLVRADGLVD